MSDTKSAVTFAVWTMRTRGDGEAGEKHIGTYDTIQSAREFAREMVEYHGCYDARVINSKGVTVWEAKKEGVKFNPKLGGKRTRVKR